MGLKRAWFTSLIKWVSDYDHSIHTICTHIYIYVYLCTCMYNVFIYKFCLVFFSYFCRIAMFPLLFFPFRFFLYCYLGILPRQFKAKVSKLNYDKIKSMTAASKLKHTYVVCSWLWLWKKMTYWFIKKWEMGNILSFL